MQVAYSRNVSHPPAVQPYVHPTPPPAMSHPQAFPYSHKASNPQLQQQPNQSAQFQPHLRSATLKSGLSGGTRKQIGGGGFGAGGGQGPQPYSRPNSAGDTFDLDADGGQGGGVAVGLDGRVHYYRTAQMTSPPAMATAPFQVLASPPPQYAQPQQFGYPTQYSNSCRAYGEQQYANSMRQGCAQINGNNAASRGSGAFNGADGAAGSFMATLTRSFEEVSKDYCGPQQQPPVVVHNSNSAGHLQHYTRTPNPTASASSASNTVPAAASLYQNVRSISGPSPGYSSSASKQKQMGHQLSQGNVSAVERRGQLLEDFTQYLASQPQYQNLPGPVQTGSKHHATKEAATAPTKDGRNRASFAGASSNGQNVQQGTLPRNGYGLGTLPRRDRTSSAKLSASASQGSNQGLCTVAGPTPRSTSHGSGIGPTMGTGTLGRTKHAANSNQTHPQAQAAPQQQGHSSGPSGTSRPQLARLSIASVSSGGSTRSPSAANTSTSATLTGSLTATTCSSPPAPGAQVLGFGQMSSSATTSSSHGTARTSSTNNSGGNSRPTTLLDAGLKPRPSPAPQTSAASANNTEGPKGTTSLADECDHFRKVAASDLSLRTALRPEDSECSFAPVRLLLRIIRPL